MITQCEECKWANQYLLWYWFPYFNPTYSKGLPMNIEGECDCFNLIGRRSR